MTELNQALLFVGALTVVLGLVTGFVRNKVYILSEPMAAVLLGIVIGPAVLGIITPEHWGPHLKILEQVARLTVAVAVMSIALRLPSGYFRSNARSMATVLSLGMLAMWVVSGLLIWALLSLPFWVAMLAGAVVTPTDPVLAGTIVSGNTAERNIPARLRHSLSGESGANDGGAYPFVFLCIYILLFPISEALTKWALDIVLWEVLGAVAAGVVIGYVAGRIQRWSASKNYLNATSMLTVTIALSFTVLGAVKLMGSDGILAVFAAGIAFNNVTNKQDEMEQQGVQETVNRLFFFPVFVLFGAMIPWGEWGKLGWGVLIAVAALILLLRRLPMMFAISPLMSSLQKKADILFNGWFGPIGVAAIYYATLSSDEIHNHAVWYVCSFIIFSSVLVHGITATPFTKIYGREERDPAERQNA